MKIKPPVDPPISVRHKNGWCATYKKTNAYADSIKTVCKHWVHLPWEIERQWPDCLECCRHLGLTEEYSMGVDYAKERDYSIEAVFEDGKVESVRKLGD